MHIVQVAQFADDLDRAAAFYAELLGEPVAARVASPARVYFNVGTTRLVLGPEAPSALVYLQVDDVPASVAAARTRGTEVVTEPHIAFTHPDDAIGPVDTDEWHAILRDSEGNLLGLISYEPRHDP